VTPSLYWTGIETSLVLGRLCFFASLGSAVREASMAEGWGAAIGCRTGDLVS
jgi:hypothetical protein